LISPISMSETIQWFLHTSDYSYNTDPDYYLVTDLSRYNSILIYEKFAHEIAKWLSESYYCKRLENLGDMNTTMFTIPHH
jgi:translation elongation factor P/translation initiation factor 5A